MSISFVCEQLRNNPENRELIKNFQIDRELDYGNSEDVIVGLEAYLKRCAWDDDENDTVRIYLIKDESSNEVVAYFGLKAGMIAANMDNAITPERQQQLLREEGIKIFPEVLPGIEISHFGINDNYRRRLMGAEGPVKGLGQYLFPEFIYPIIEDVGKKIGVHLVYLYAAGDDRLVQYYKEVFGFTEISDFDKYTPLEPAYDDGCRFMYQRFFSTM